MRAAILGSEPQKRITQTAPQGSTGGGWVATLQFLEASSNIMSVKAIILAGVGAMSSIFSSTGKRSGAEENPHTTPSGVLSS
jgi:hypothetical protein